MPDNDSLRIEIYKGKITPKTKKGAKVYTITKRSKQTIIKEVYDYYQAHAEVHDVTINGAIRMENTFTSPENYQAAVMMYINMVIENKMNPLKYYDGINVEVAIELEKLRMMGHDLRDHFRGPDFSPIDVRADAPHIIQNSPGGGSIH